MNRMGLGAIGIRRLEVKTIELLKLGVIGWERVPEGTPYEFKAQATWEGSSIEGDTVVFVSQD